jgi:hypothetical protein
MGITESKCVSLSYAVEYLVESYTVVRTSGQQEIGWLLANTPHHCYNRDPRSWRPRAHAYLKQEGWSVYLHNGDASEENPDAHCCGWRRLGTFWPTRLTGDEAGIKSWTNSVRERLEDLAGKQGLPDLWAEHSCSRGAPPDYCDGCCAERRAKEKKEILDQLDAITAEREPLKVRVEAILQEKQRIYNTKDLWDPKWGDRWDELEEEECQVYREQSALDDKAFPLQEALKKIPTAAGHRRWLAAKEEGTEAL